MLVLCLAISIPVFATNAPLTIRATSASTSFEDDTFTLVYSKAVTETTLRFSNKNVRLFADPLHDVPLTLSDKKLTLRIDQGVTRVYFVYEDTDYTIVLDAPRTPTEYSDEHLLTAWARHYIQYLNLSGSGLMTGDTAKAFHDADDLTRYETAVIAVRMLGVDAALVKGGNPYKDKLVSWAKPYVLALTRLGVLEGETAADGMRFNGDRSITRSEVAKILVSINMLLTGETKSVAKLSKEESVQKAFTKQSFTDLADIPAWAKNWLTVAVGKYGLLSGSKENGGLWLYPTRNITRAEIATMLARLDHFSEKGLLEAYLSHLAEYYRTQQKLNTQNGKLFIAAYKEAEDAVSYGTEKECKAAFDALRLIYNKMNMIIYLSPSHQMENRYAGYNTNEGAEMIAVGKIVEANLTAKGYRVYTPPVEMDLIERGEEANRMGAVCYVAIHSNAIAGTNRGGSQGATVFHSFNKGSKELAQFLHDQLSALTPTKDHGIKNDMLTAKPYKEIRVPEMANVIAEVEYHDYAPYAAWIIAHKADIAAALTKGIEDYMNTL